MTAGMHVLLAEPVDSVRGNFGQRWRFGQRTSIRPSELELSADESFHLKAVFVDGTVVTPTEQGQVRECRRTAFSPMLKVMALREASPTAGEPTAAVAMLQSPS